MSIHVCVNVLTSQVYKWNRTICVSIARITVFMYVHHVCTCSFFCWLQGGC